MKKAQVALALALLGAVCSLCLEGMKRIGEYMDRDEKDDKKDT